MSEDRGWAYAGELSRRLGRALALIELLLEDDVSASVRRRAIEFLNQELPKDESAREESGGD